MSDELIGTLYGVDISLPLKRSEIRELAKAQKNFINNLLNEKQLNENQASLDASDLLIEFSKKLSEEDAEQLSTLLDQENLALMPSIQESENQLIKDTNNQVEAETNHLQAQFIFNELSANLSVYGSNSSLTGANPANIDLALEYINRCLEIDPNNATYLNLKGLLLWQGKSDRERALPLIQKAAQLNPRDITIQHNLKAIEDPKGCFIATASYGTPIAYEINELRYWRDTKLSKNIYGKMFISTYYKVSPPIARLIVKSPKAKKLIRKMLKPLISYAKSANEK